MPLPSPAATDAFEHGPFRSDRRSPLERPVLTVTGAVGLLLGSLAWALTGQFMAAPLVFAASLTTALALAVALEDQAGAAEATAVDLAERLRQA